MKSKSQRNLIRVALKQIDPECFQLLYEFWINDRNIEEIAIAMGKTTDEMRDQHQKCRERFIQLIKHDENIT